jgi:hypothetical protein
VRTLNASTRLRAFANAALHRSFSPIIAVSFAQLSLRVFPPRLAVLDRVDPADIALDLTEAIFAHLLDLLGGVSFQMA